MCERLRYIICVVTEAIFISFENIRSVGLWDRGGIKLKKKKKQVTEWFQQSTLSEPEIQLVHFLICSSYRFRETYFKLFPHATTRMT